MATKGIVFDVKRFAVHDGPGIRTTVFFKGCPLRCAWCHNPEGISPRPEIMVFPDRCLKGCRDCLALCPKQALRKGRGTIVLDRARCDGCGACAEACPSEALRLVGRSCSSEGLMEEISRDAPFFSESGGGVTFSGGEPLQQPIFLKDLLTLCRLEGLHVAVDTSGHAPYSDLEAILPLVDLFLFDLKAVDDSLHRQLTGVTNRLILDNLGRLSGAGAPLVLRVPLVPGGNDPAGELERMADFCASLPRRHPLHLLPYHRGYAAKLKRLGRGPAPTEIAPPAEQALREAREVFARRDLSVTIGG
ncbi:MAG: glycyl-radical enzyme activating protein [Candidatus Aminicenantes bacterium]|nr:glycyl-radical enzyme activating protein [Candidatus Aminicenantes bacterium]